MRSLSNLRFNYGLNLLLLEWFLALSSSLLLLLLDFLLNILVLCNSVLGDILTEHLLIELEWVLLSEFIV